MQNIQTFGLASSLFGGSGAGFFFLFGWNS